MCVSWVDMIFRIECEFTLCELSCLILDGTPGIRRLRGRGIEIGEEVRERKWDLNVQHIDLLLVKKKKKKTFRIWMLKSWILFG